MTQNIPFPYSIQSTEYFRSMGNQCLATTPNQKYSRYLQNINVSELKDLWQTVKVYKIKGIFEEAAQPNPQHPNHEYLSYSGFKSLFPEFQNFPEQQVKRLYDFFDIDSKGFVDWNSFFSALTICYYGSERDLAVLMFIMFDHALEFELDQNYLALMVQTNQPYLKTNQLDQPLEYEEVLLKLKGSGTLHIQKWLKEANKFFQFSKFRKLFNVFVEQKMQKQLVKHFSSWNTIYNSQKEKYIGYLINLKWFECWQLYIENNYNTTIDIFNANLPTVKTLKTCKKATMKSIKNSRSGKSSKDLLVQANKDNHGCRLMAKGTKQSKKEDFIKDYDCIHAHLGEKPRQIGNQHLEGEFQEVLRDNINENMDYLIVSQKVWNHLKTIYGGYPQFRRTGIDSIELYPKVVCIYFSLFKGYIDYSSQVLRQVSAYLSVEQMLVKSCDVAREEVNKKVIYFKTIGMKRWQLIDDSSYLFTELSSDIMIFMVCISQSERETFEKNHQKHPRDVTEVNLGDKLTYLDPSQNPHTVIFMGKNTEGKYILHFSGESYSNDLCLMEAELLKHCKLAAELHSIEPQKRLHSGLIGLPSGPGLGFINTVFLQLFNNKEVRKLLQMMDESRDDKLLYNLAKINNLIAKQCRVESQDIKLLVQVYLSQYNDFEVSMCKNIINDIFSLLSSELKEEELPNNMNERYQVEVNKTIFCTHCNSKNNMKDHKSYLYSVIIPQESFYYLEVIWVPLLVTSTEIIKYVVKLGKTATLGEFMQAIETQIGSKQKLYVLAEVHGNDIIKNYSFAKKNITLKALKIRQNDKFYAFQLTTNFNSFVGTHFSNRQNIYEDEMKKDMLIDCKHEERGWVFGKVIQVDYLPYTQASFVRVQHKFNKNQSWQITYNCFEDCVARFPLKSHKNSQQYHLKALQRRFNEAANAMQLIGMPLIVTIPSWMRWKEFFFYVFLQIKSFIAEPYSFDLQAAEQQPLANKKQTTKAKGTSAVDKFKEYKNSSKFPYHLRLMDYEGRCVVCLKFVKSKVFKGQNQSYCEGCQLSQNEPISWQVKPADLIICIDWKGSDRYRKDIVFNSKSASLMIEQAQKQEAYSLTCCLDQMKNQYSEIEQFLCCNMLSQKKIKESIIKTGDSLTIFVERIVQESDGFKKVIKRPLKFTFEGLVVDKKKYNLVGMTSIEGQHFNIRYKTYTIKAKGEWYEYDGQVVRLVDQRHLLKQCALVLYYQKA